MFECLKVWMFEFLGKYTEFFNKLAKYYFEALKKCNKADRMQSHAVTKLY